jgi:hypothetical protein
MNTRARTNFLLFLLSNIPNDEENVYDWPNEKRKILEPLQMILPKPKRVIHCF